MPARVGKMAIVAVWDTGQFGSLNTSKESKAQLIEEGRLTPSQAKPDTIDLHGLTLHGHAMPVVRGIDVQTEPSPVAALIGIVEPDQLNIGYGLLHQFKSVWGYRRRRIYLLAR